MSIHNSDVQIKTNCAVRRVIVPVDFNIITNAFFVGYCDTLLSPVMHSHRRRVSSGAFSRVSSVEQASTCGERGRVYGVACGLLVRWF